MAPCTPAESSRSVVPAAEGQGHKTVIYSQDGTWGVACPHNAPSLHARLDLSWRFTPPLHLLTLAILYAGSLQQNGKGSNHSNKLKQGPCGIACPTQAPASTPGAASHLAPPCAQEAADFAHLGTVAQQPQFKGWERHKPCRPVSPSRLVAFIAARADP